MTRIRIGFLVVLLCGSAAARELRAEEKPTLESRLESAALGARHRLDYDGKSFSGPGWQLLLEEGRSAQFVLLGEQHGIAENPRLAAVWFEALVPAGFAKLAIEISPPMAGEIDRALRTGGLDGLRELFALPGGEPAFFGMKEEAELLAAARAAVPGDGPVLWGLDYEVAADRHLIRMLRARPMPPEAKRALEALAAAADQSWNAYREEQNPALVFSFSGDPALVRDLEEVWPERDPDSATILDSLEATLEINRLWSAGESWRSNALRAQNLRTNFLRYWRAEKAAGRAPGVFLKFGSTHMVRGLNSVATFDLGTLVPEIAALEGGRVFSLLVLAGRGSPTAVFDPVEWTYRPSPPRDRYAEGLEPILAAGYDDAFTLVDLRPLRPLLRGSARDEVPDRLMRVVHGYDAVLLMTGSTPSSELDR